MTRGPPDGRRTGVGTCIICRSGPVSAHRHDPKARISATLTCTPFPEEIWWTLAGPFAVDENRCALVALRRRCGLVCEAVEEIGAGALPGSGVPGCACEREYQPPRSYWGFGRRRTP